MFRFCGLIMTESISQMFIDLLSAVKFKSAWNCIIHIRIGRPKYEWRAKLLYIYNLTARIPRPHWFRPWIFVFYSDIREWEELGLCVGGSWQNKLCMIIDRRSGSIINVLFSINSMRVKSLFGHHRQTQVSINPEISKEQSKVMICISATVPDHRSCLLGKSLIFAAVMGSTTELQQLQFIFCFPVSLIFFSRIRLRTGRKLIIQPLLEADY